MQKKLINFALVLSALAGLLAACDTGTQPGGPGETTPAPGTEPAETPEPETTPTTTPSP